MPNIYIIMGDANAGKSTIIRALTGMGHPRGDWKIKPMNRPKITIYILSHALQEDVYLKTVKDLLRKSKDCDTILVALRIKGRDPVRGSGYYHIREFKKQGCTISQIVVLADAHRQNQIRRELRNIGRLPIAHFFPPQREPANAIASKIRKKWKWL
jgi:ABC-type methionine transport system ATPase subunit